MISRVIQGTGGVCDTDLNLMDASLSSNVLNILRYCSYKYDTFSLGCGDFSHECFDVNTVNTSVKHVVFEHG